MKKAIKPYIDIHTHFLFGVDDGPSDMETSIKMLEKAIVDGMEGAVLTNHFHGGYIEYKELADRNFNTLQAEVTDRGMNVNLYRGNELYLCEETVDAVRHKWPESMNGNGTLLVEIPQNLYDPAVEAMLYDIQAAGYEVVLAHAERYDFLFQQPEITEMILARSCRFQVNGEAFSDRKKRKKIMQWIRDGHVKYIASDCHDLKRRPPGLSKIYRYISKKLGEETADDLFYNNPVKMLGI